MVLNYKCNFRQPDKDPTIRIIGVQARSSETKFYCQVWYQNRRLDIQRAESLSVKTDRKR